MPKETFPILAVEVPKRIKNFHELDKQKQMQRVWQEIAKDFYFYCEKNLYITNKKGELVKFRPNQAQRKLIDAVFDDLKHGRPVRYIVLKARQMGLSTVIEALAYWWAATHKYVTASIIAHERDASANIYQMFQRYYDNSDPAFKPQTKYLTKNDLTFDVERKPGQKTSGGLKSQIRTAVAKEGATGRSQTNRFVHASEVAFWKGGSEIVAGLMQTVPMLPETFIFLESTANGIGGYFYDTWMKAKKGESSFKPFFFPWHEHKEYEMNVPSVRLIYDAEETELLKLFTELGYDKVSQKRKIMWRREKLKEFAHDSELFFQEYPSTDLEAFIASGRPVFDTKQLIKMDRLAESTPFEMYDLTGDHKKVSEMKLDLPMAQLLKTQGLRVWHKPEMGHRYVIGADVAEGIEITAGDGKDSDYSVATVMDRETRKTVARYRGHIDPDVFGDYLCLLGWWYNNATIAVEINNQGLATVQRLRDKLYRNLYMRESGYDELFEEPTAKMGWRTDKASKYIMITDLAKAIREGSFIDLDQVFVRECMTYVRDESGRTNAQDGQHDDTVMATAIALQLFTWEKIDREAPKPVGGVKNRLGNNNKITSFRGVYKRTQKIKQTHG